MTSFNSIVVRLKESMSRGGLAERPMFQFHSGSIKSGDLLWRDADAFKFQFHSGSIKRATISIMPGIHIMFQFHSGSIKRARKRSRITLATAVSIP